MYVREQSSDELHVVQFQPPQDFLSRAQRFWWRRRSKQRLASYDDPRAFELFTDAQTPFGSAVIQQFPEADIINLHWVVNFINLQELFARGRTPIVWTLHDMNAFTGGCHYDNRCGRYADACGVCPQLNSQTETDLSRETWHEKQRAYAALRPSDLHIVTPSTWLKREVEASSLLGRFPVSTIPNGVDTEVFKPHDAAALRRAFDLAPDSKIVLFVAAVASSRRKGFHLLLEAVEALSSARDDLCLMSVGSSQPRIESGVPHIHLGHIESERLLAAIYSSADLFVIPSLQDNLPNTVLEAMACGTPVVGFDTGGIPDMVRPGETGWLAGVGDVRALREAIQRALSDDAGRTRMGRQCRAVVEKEYTLEVQTQRYMALYRKMIEVNEDELQLQ
jgi:glycosyltransferase involved in cell wall biosynthesis